MNIHKKIESIRSKPEHERLRYVWGAVAISMFFIILIWILSVKISLQKNQGKPQSQSLPDIGAQLQDIKNSAPSLQDINTLANESAAKSQSPAGTATSADNPAQAPQQ